MELALTTTDNPYSPFDEWEQWMSYDQEYGHNTNEKIARVSNPSMDIEDEEVLSYLYLQACLLIMEYDLEGIYTMVSQSTDDPV